MAKITEIWASRDEDNHYVEIHLNKPKWAADHGTYYPSVIIGYLPFSMFKSQFDGHYVAPGRCIHLIWNEEAQKWVIK